MVVRSRGRAARRGRRRSAARRRARCGASTMYSRRPERETETAYELFSRGMGFLADGHPHQAAMLLARAKLLEPDKASIREALGRAWYMAGPAGPARREFTKA